MKIKLKKKENSYAQVHKNMLFDRTLSLKAKGLGAILESYSNDFDVNMKSIELNNADGLKAIRGAIKELEDGYYLFRFQIRENGGLFTTVWAFDSEKLDVDYLKNIVNGLEKIELITKNDLLQRGTQNGNPVKPLAGYPFTACRQRTPYNNKEYKNIKDYKDEVCKRKITPVPLDVQDFDDKIIVTYPRFSTTVRPARSSK